jgi:PBP1b-binding outer membrane lipoprotein LpoB
MEVFEMKTIIVLAVLSVALLLFGCVQQAPAAATPTPTPTPAITPTPTPAATPTPGAAEVEQEASEIDGLIRDLWSVGEIADASEAGELNASLG